MIFLKKCSLSPLIIWGRKEKSNKNSQIKGGNKKAANLFSAAPGGGRSLKEVIILQLFLNTLNVLCFGGTH